MARVNKSTLLTKRALRSGNPVDFVEYNGVGSPVEIRYNLEGNDTQTVYISWDEDGAPTIDGIKYINHSVNVWGATLQLGDPIVPPPAIADTSLSADVIDETAAVDTVIGIMTTVGGTAPFVYNVETGQDLFKMVGDELQVRDSIDNQTSPYTIEIQVTDANNVQFTKSFDITIIDNPIITDITGVVGTITEDDIAGTLVSSLTPVGGTAPYSWSVTDPDGYFVMNGADLELNVSDIPRGEYTASVTVDDDKTRSYSEDIVVTVDPGVYVSELSTSFDGTTEFIRCGNDSSLQIVDELSVFAWVKIASTSVANTVAAKYHAGISQRAWSIAILGSGQCRVRMSSNSSSDTKSLTTTGAPTIDDNTWHFVGFTYSSGTLKIYVDGTSYPYVGTDNPMTTIHNATTDLSIGALNNGGDRLSGLIDEVSIWNTNILTDAEVVALYNSGTPIEIGIDQGDYTSSDDAVSWWRMGEGSTSPTINDALSSNDGSMMNMDQSNFVADTP